MRRSPLGASAAISGSRRPEASNTPVACSSSSGLEQLQVRRVLPDAGQRTWCERNVPSTGFPSTTFGPVQPLGERRTSSASAPRHLAAPFRRAIRDTVEIANHLSSVAAMSGCMIADRRLRRNTARSEAPEHRLELLVRDPRQHRGPGDLRAVQVEDGSTAPSRAGLRNLFDCHEVASAPVSASPSPPRRRRAGRIVERSAKR